MFYTFQLTVFYFFTFKLNFTKIFQEIESFFFAAGGISWLAGKNQFMLFFNKSIKNKQTKHSVTRQEQLRSMRDAFVIIEHRN